MEFLSKSENRVVLKLDSLDDFLYLKQIMEKGDLIRGKSSRKIKLGSEGGRQKSIKKSIWVTIKVNQIEIGSKFRATGSVESEIVGIPLNSSHSIDFESGSEVEIDKENWKPYQLNLIKDAERASKAPKALICVLDDEISTFAHITASGYTSLGQLNLRLSKKRYQEHKNQGEKDITKVANAIIKNYEEYEVNNIILGSPLFWKEIVSKKVLELDKNVASKISLEDVSGGDESGIREIISGKVLERIIKDSKLAKDEKSVNNLLELIAKRSALVTYGMKNIKHAVDHGAVEDLILTDKIMDSNEIGTILDSVEKSGGSISIINSTSSAGKKLNGLKGIIAKLRFKTK